MVSLGQIGFALMRLRVPRQGFNNGSTVQEITGQRWTIAQRLQGSVHVAGVGEILKAHQTAELPPVVAYRAIVQLLPV